MGVRLLANILDPVRDGLDPSVFDDPEGAAPTLKPALALFAENAIFGALRDAGYPSPEAWVDLALTGSLTTYQYGPSSDFDVSLWVDEEVAKGLSGEVPERRGLIATMIDKVDGTRMPGTPYPMQAYVLPWRDVTREQIYRPGLRSAWSITDSRWIVPPERDRAHDVEHEYPEAFHKAALEADRMSQMLEYHPKHVRKLWNRLHSRRHADQLAGRGDFADSNIAYKYMAHLGMFPRIAETTGLYIAGSEAR